MPRVIPLSAKEVIKILEKCGWYLNNLNGRHRIFVHKNYKGHVSVPDHKELQTGTLCNIIRQSGMTVDEFYKMVYSK